MTQYTKTQNLLLAALFTALTAIGAYISVPLPFTPVPVTLASLSAMIAGGLLGSKYGGLSQLTYLLLGAAGAPVFHNFTAGAGIIAGPTGGFIMGYIAIAVITGALLQRGVKITLSFIPGVLACYVIGAAWFMVATGSGPAAAVISCILPFIAGDALKVAAASFLIKRLRPVVL